MSSPESTSTSTSASNIRKRKHEGDDSKQLVKKQKKLTKEELQEEHLRGRAKELREAVSILQDVYKDCLLEEGILKSTFKILLLFCDTVQQPNFPRDEPQLTVLREPIPFLDEDVLSELLPGDDRDIYKESVNAVNAQLKQIARVYEELLEKDTHPPPASHYAEITTWTKWQQKSTAILNLRPGRNKGLPLSALHPIFARFRATLKQQPPETVSDPAALHAAYNLCIEMANAFEDESTRWEEFETCITPLLFPGYEFEYKKRIESKLEHHPSTAGLLVTRNGKYVLLGENKVDLGAGDAYMQLSRVYQALVNQLKDERPDALPRGVPMILICVIGPLFIAAGGFYDGNSVLVEPLAAPCLMLPDYHHQRQEELARLLVSIKDALEGIAELDYTTKVAFGPNLPRIYTTFTSFEGQTIDLTFESRLEVKTGDPQGKLLFLATIPTFTSTSTRQVLVKLVAGDQYATEAHRKVAQAGYAPTLLGIAEVNGAHTAYVMEYLSPDEEWETLYEYARGVELEDVLSSIKEPLGHLLGMMRKERIVHGDFRPNNMMVRPVEDAGELEIKLVDFDWAGVSGEARYPWRRNEDILWPVGPGEMITNEHDRTLLMACLRKQKGQGSR